MKRRPLLSTVKDGFTRLLYHALRHPGGAEVTRLRGEVERLTQENRALAGALRQAEERAGRLRRLAARTGPPCANGAFTVRLPFAYTGPGGRVALSRGFEVGVPAPVVHRLDLADGDLIELSLTLPDRVNLKVVDRLPRREVLGHAKRHSAETWEVVGTDARRVGWIGDAEARAHDLRDGDPLTVMRPEVEMAGDGERTFLPRVRILRVYREVELPPPDRRETNNAQRLKERRSRATHQRKVHRRESPLGRLTPAGRPLAGKRVLVVGAESFHPGYRRIVESLGGVFEGLGAGDLSQAEAKARAADIVVLVTPYLAHKVGDVVEGALARAGRESRLTRANTTGHRGLLEALRPFLHPS
ncbi:MAG: hypothetical protein AB1645_04145 [Bacillota bacterium]